MSLIKLKGLPVFKDTGGFKYAKYWEYYKKHDALHWTSSEINLAKDIQDFQNASPREREFITNIMRLFTQNEVTVENGYTTLLRIFKPVEVQAMLFNFGAREFTHIENYSLFTETVGLPASIYTEFLDIPVMSTKTEYLHKAKVRKFEEYKSAGLSEAEVHKEYRKDIARMLGVYGAFAEGVSLFAQFAALLKFQFDNKYPGLTDINNYSIKEEYLHHVGNTDLFRDFIAENPDIWDDELKFSIYEACRETVAYEHALIDYLDPPHMSREELKAYVEYCADNALKNMGMKANYGSTKNPLPYMDDVLSAVQVDFFSGRETGYTKQVQGNWEDIKYDHWKTKE
jgi:ribonucleoside-diphosphate reductase beta chain